MDWQEFRVASLKNKFVILNEVGALCVLHILKVLEHKLEAGMQSADMAVDIIILTHQWRMKHC